MPLFSTRNRKRLDLTHPHLLYSLTKVPRNPKVPIPDNLHNANEYKNNRDQEPSPSKPYYFGCDSFDDEL